MVAETCVNRNVDKVGLYRDMGNRGTMESGDLSRSRIVDYPAWSVEVSFTLLLGLHIADLS